MRTWVKICGITRVEDARAAFDCGADAIGLNFWPGSKRHCTLDQALEISAAVGPEALVFGVFVRAAREEIARIVRGVGLGGVQLHGEETLAEAEGWDLPVIRAVGASGRDTVARALAEADVRDENGPADRDVVAGNNRDHVAAKWKGHRLLLDNASGGGSGKAVDSAFLEGFDLRRSIVAGGLTADNVAAIVSRLSPFGVDTAGGVETSPGIKDARAIEAFVREARRRR